VSRSHPNLVRRLFELEIPEILAGTVEIKAVAREAGYRSKVAVAAVQERIDPVGCCVGLRGIRIQNIVNELNGEKLDIVIWSPDPSAFISNALGPAQVLSVALSEEEEIATVVVPDKQLSLAIGREGQNARLAARLTGWRIDIKSASEAEAEKAEAAKLAAETEPEAAVSEEVATGPETEAPVEEMPPAEVPLVPYSALASTQEDKEEVEPVLDTTLAPEEVAPSPPPEAKPRVRFAEDLTAPEPVKPEAKSKKKKKKSAYAKRRGEDGIKIKKVRRGSEISLDEDYEEY
jgi:N utilization substance protein A